MSTSLLDNSGEIVISVYRGAFDFCRTEGELASMLDHEYIHVGLLKGRKVKVPYAPEELRPELERRVFGNDGDLSRYFHELVAYSHQIRIFKRRHDLTSGFKREIRERYDLWREAVLAKEQDEATIWLLKGFPPAGGII